MGWCSVVHGVFRSHAFLLIAMLVSACACVEFTGGISVMPGDDPEHYDFVLTRRVTSSLTPQIPRGSYQFRYRYAAGKYILKKSSPLKPADYDSRPSQSNATVVCPSPY